MGTHQSKMAALTQLLSVIGIFALCTGLPAKTTSATNCDQIECFDPYDPVCASDGNVYSNKCYMSIRMCERPNFPWRTLHMTACASKKKKRYVGGPRPKTCDDMECFDPYDPVCTTDGLVYSNRCYMAIQQCRRPDFPLRVIDMGACNSRKKRSVIFTSSSSSSSSSASSSSSSSSSGSSSSSSKSRRSATTKCEDIECFDPYDPVCASDGNVYSNLCYMSIQQCRRPNFPWRTHPMGACYSKKKRSVRATTTTNCDAMECFDPY